MSALLNDWLHKHTRLPGVLAGGIGYPDHTLVVQPYGDHFPPEALENTWRCIADTYEVMNLHRFPPIELHWIYAQAQLYCVRRPDKIFLGLLISNEPGAIDQAEVKDLFADFKAQ